MNADISQFDPSTFLDATTTEALARRPPLPAASVYVGTIVDLASRSWTSQKETAKVKAGIAVDLKIEIDLTAYPEAQKLVGVDKVTLNDGIMLDMNSGGMIDWSIGKNGKLRRYREALGMNEAGQTFSIRQMQGRQIRVKIKHRPYEGEMFEEVESVAKV